jgi:hypothetical protein
MFAFLAVSFVFSTMLLIHLYDVEKNPLFSSPPPLFLSLVSILVLCFLYITT